MSTQLLTTADKLPIQYVRELPDLLSVSFNGRRLSPFSVVSIEPCHLVPIETIAAPPLQTSKAIDKLITWVRLDTYLKVGGLDLAKKQMNVHGNFNRDVRGILNHEEFPHDLNSVLRSDLEVYFERSSSTRRKHEL